MSIIAQDTGTTPATVGRLLLMLRLQALRPMRISSDTQVDIVRADESAADLGTVGMATASNLLDPQSHVDHDSRERFRTTIIEWPFAAILHWLDNTLDDALPLAEWRDWVPRHGLQLEVESLLEGAPTSSAQSNPAAHNITHSLTLTPEEFAEITGKSRGYAQRTRLNELGISSRLRSDGRIIVFRDDLTKNAQGKSKAKQHPNFGALD
ncbi:DUF4224 domain-containing protein [Granulosicoccus sp. 3-233]|uniref:DUF4224 domain-containing protein n=1 Tax=Granulosicoccus sp. 3-233 TaxID=3417969 RepID=UPI003D343A1A